MSQQFLPPSLNIQPNWMPYQTPKAKPTSAAKSAIGKASKLQKGYGIGSSILGFAPTALYWNADGSDFGSRLLDFTGGIGNAAGNLLGYMTGHPVLGGLGGAGLGYYNYNAAAKRRMANTPYDKLQKNQAFLDDVFNSLSPDTQAYLNQHPEMKKGLQSGEMAETNQILLDAKNGKYNLGDENVNNQDNLYHLNDNGGIAYGANPYMIPNVPIHATANRDVTDYIKMQDDRINKFVGNMNTEANKTARNDIAKQQLAMELLNKPYDYSKGYTPADIQYLQTMRNLQSLQNQNNYKDWVNDPFTRNLYLSGFGLDANKVFKGEALNPQEQLDRQMAFAQDQYKTMKAAEENAKFLDDVARMALAGYPYIAPSFVNDATTQAQYISSLVNPTANENINARNAYRDAEIKAGLQGIVNTGNLLRSDQTGLFGNDRQYLGGYFNTINQNSRNALEADKAELNAKIRQLDIASRQGKVDLSAQERTIIEGVKAGLIDVNDALGLLQKYGSVADIPVGVGGGGSVLMTPLDNMGISNNDIPLPKAPMGRAPRSRGNNYGR